MENLGKASEEPTVATGSISGRVDLGPALVAIINSYNRLELMRFGLPSLLAALSDLPFQCAVVVFDAGSTDGSREWLEALDSGSRVQICRVYPKPGDDTSFSAGVNAACEYCAERFPSVEFLLLFETDNWITGSTPLRNGLTIMQQQSGIGVLGFTVQKHSGHPAGYGSRFPGLLEFILGPQFASSLGISNWRALAWQQCGSLRWRFCDVVYTSPVLVKAAAWRRGSGLDAAVFPFSECDVDWCWRLKKMGWASAVMQTDGVVHDNKSIPSAWSAARVISFHQARLRLFERHYGTWVDLLLPLLLLRHAVEYLVLLALYASGRKPRESLGKRWLLLRSVLWKYRLPMVKSA